MVMSPSLRKRLQSRYVPAALIILGFVIIGLIVLQLTRAASPAVSAEVENGVLTGQAIASSDSLASNGKAVRFSGETPGTVPPGFTPPANPKLSREGRNVLYFLQSLPGKNILAGQHETDRCTKCESDRMLTITGKMPAMHGHDVADYVIDPIQESINDWNVRKQIVTFSWHFGAPPLNDLSFTNSQATADVNKVLQPGTAENTVYMAKLEKMAGRLQVLENAQVPVVWRPLHEMNGGWFWWSKSGPEPYKRLWIHMYDYLTYTKGLDNLIWAWSAALNKSPDAAWYPGHQYVDITGSDTYDNFSNMATWSAHYQKHKQIAPTKPVALTETDLIPDPQQLIDTKTHMIWFLPWYGQYVDKNTADFKRRVYNHPYVITADEMPDLKQTFPQ